MKWIVKTGHHFGNQSFANQAVGLRCWLCKKLPYSRLFAPAKAQLNGLKHKKIAFSR
jgi:hypothetical protein